MIKYSSENLPPWYMYLISAKFYERSLDQPINSVAEQGRELGACISHRRALSTGHLHLTELWIFSTKNGNYNCANSVSQMNLNFLKEDRQINKLLITWGIRSWFLVYFYLVSQCPYRRILLQILYISHLDHCHSLLSILPLPL